MDAELDAKADKSQVDSKVNRSVFDSTIGDLQKMIDDLLSKLLAYVSLITGVSTQISTMLPNSGLLVFLNLFGMCDTANRKVVYTDSLLMYLHHAINPSSSM